MKETSNCIYCGSSLAENRSREHIIQEALGGTKWIEFVCETCNNDFSRIDRELTSRSPLSLVVVDVFGPKLGQSWEVDQSARNLLLEANPSWRDQQLTVWPQLVLDDDDPIIYGDNDEQVAFGQERFAEQLNLEIRHAFDRHESGKKRFQFVRQDVEIERNGLYRYQPRVFVRRRIQEVNSKTTFHIGYVHRESKNRLLSFIADELGNQRFENRSKLKGSEQPVFVSTWEMSACLRALMKIAVNLLANHCEKTPVNAVTFRQPVSVIRGQTGLPARYVGSNGFIPPDKLAWLAEPTGGHRVAIHHESGFWHARYSFFGGRVCAALHFPGPNNENWTRITATQRINGSNSASSPAWSVETGRLVIPLLVCPEFNVNNIVPSVNIYNTQMRFQRISVPRS